MKHKLDGHLVHISTGGVPFDASRRTLLFLHGSGQSHLTWVLQGRFFAHRSHAVLAPDFPGHGLSAGKPLSSIAAQAAWTARLVESLGAREVIVVAHSQGVLVALEACAATTMPIGALVLVAGATSIPVNDALVKMSKSAPDKAFAMMTSWGHGPAAHKFDNSQPGHAHLGYGRRVMAMNHEDALGTDLVACNEYKGGAAAAAGVRVPTLCLLAARDRMTPLKFGRRMADDIDGSSCVVLENAGHFIPTERPLELNRAMMSFIAGLPGAAASASASTNADAGAGAGTGTQGKIQKRK